MEFYQALILGFIQGVTEFLPVSSSGHLVIFQRLFGLMEPEIFFDICVHVGTLVAVIFYFRQQLYTIISSVVRIGLLVLQRKVSVNKAYEDPDIKMAVYICVSLIPTVIAGLLIKQVADILFTSVFITGIMLVITGAILWPTKRFQGQQGVTKKELTLKTALIIGLVQGFAVIPGISRSGSTIAVGLFCGIDREEMAQFSFLMSIPAITGAAILSLKDVESLAGISYQVILPGMLLSCITGYLALSFLVFIVKKGRLFAFAPYCWLAGIVAILSGYFIL